MTIGESADLVTGEDSLDTYTPLTDDTEMPDRGVQIPCKAHKKIVTQYCLRCAVFLCDNCLMTSDHDGHVTEMKEANETVSLIRGVLLDRGRSSKDVAELVRQGGEKENAKLKEQIALLIRRADYEETPLLLNLKKKLLKVRTEIQRLAYTIYPNGNPAKVLPHGKLENADIQTDQQNQIFNKGPVNFYQPSEALVSMTSDTTENINDYNTATSASGATDGLGTTDISAGLENPLTETHKWISESGPEILCTVHEKEVMKYCSKCDVFLCDDCLITTDREGQVAELMPAAEKLDQIKEVLLDRDNSSTDVWMKKLTDRNSHTFEDDVTPKDMQDEEKKKAHVELQIEFLLIRAEWEKMSKLRSLVQKLSKVQNEIPHAFKKQDK